MKERKRPAGGRVRLPLSEDKRREIKFSGREPGEDENNERPHSRGNYGSRSSDGGQRRSSSGSPRGKRNFEDNEKPQRKSFGRSERGGDEDRPQRRSFGRSERGGDEDRPQRRSFGRSERGGNEERPQRRSFGRSERGGNEERPQRRSFGRSERGGDEDRPQRRSFGRSERGGNEDRPKRRYEKSNDSGDLIRLNKYIANAGICSRREADVLIQSGAISVNGKPVTELGFKVSRTDKIMYGDQTLNSEKLKYLLLNKPKGFITTVDDPEDRKTVMSLVEKACKERIYPVGRLDRNTTGLLLFTNDGELAKKLTHPKYGIRKIYHVVLDKNLTKNDMLKISEGVELEDGMVEVDAIEYIQDANDKKEIGIELHSGQNRVVRRIFESMGYKVDKLDRVAFAGLTKKNLPRGEYRFLTQMEINSLKMIH